MADHDLFVGYNDDTLQFEPKRLEARFYDRGTLRVKYDDSEQYWRDFVNKWWHHDGLSFRQVELTTEQQGRLDEVNINNVASQYLSEVAEYVKYGAVSADTTEPYLATIAADAAVVEARVEKRRDELRQRLAERRYEEEVGGTALADGTPILTDRPSQAQLASTYTTLKDGLKTSIDWKGANGWAVVTVTEITPIAQASADHVQECFTAEKAVDDLITAALEADLEEFDVPGTFETELAALRV